MVYRKIIIKIEPFSYFFFFFCNLINLFLFQHHCRNCGDIFCSNCSEQVVPLPNDNGQLGKPVRVCDSCWDVINAHTN